jgi:hypothetical protein
LHKKPPQYNPGYKVGQVADGLNGFLEPEGPHFIEEQGKDNWRREAKYQFKGTYDNGIPEYLPETTHAKEEFKVIKPNPGAFHDPLAEDKVLERYLYAVHGGVTEYAIINDGRDKEDKKIPVFPIQDRRFMCG